MSVIDEFENNLLHGGARWVAELNEFFRDYRISDTNFSLYARGSTRGKAGLFLSRFFASTVLPNYSVSLFCTDEGESDITPDRVKKRAEAVSHVVRDEGLHWAWLVIFSKKPIPPQTESYVSRYEKNEIGLAVVSISSSQIVFSNNTLGRSIGGHLGLRRIMRKRAEAGNKRKN